MTGIPGNNLPNSAAARMNTSTTSDENLGTHRTGAIPSVSTASVAARTAGPVHIIGAGLLGASIGLGLRARGVEVTLEDVSPTVTALAADYGAGRPRVHHDPEPALVIVATPPDLAAGVIKRALAEFSSAVVTDVVSVKLAPLNELRDQGVSIDRYVGSHPMAGRERGGAMMARADLFVGRPWVICRDAETTAATLATVEAVALDLGAMLVEMAPEEHDQAVGLVSHLPQLVASALAARLVSAPEQAIALASSGLRDTTRIAESDPELWVQILGSNSERVIALLDGLSDDLATVRNALEDPNALGAKRKIAGLLAAGNRGVARLPGKHGSDEQFVRLQVLVNDTPGELGRLLTELGELGINMEDLRLEHSPGAQLGFAEIAVIPEVAERAVNDLRARGWRTL